MRTISQRELRNDSGQVLREVESGRTLIITRRGTPVACNLLETELRRAAHRSQALSQRAVSDLLGRFALYDVPASILIQAGLPVKAPGA